MEAFIGTILPFAGKDAPAGWALCQGQLLPISRYKSLFQLIGTDFGGDGVTTFALPDLQGRFPIGIGAGAGLSTRTRGQQGGVETVTLTVPQMPLHTHVQLVSTDAGTTGVPSSTVLPSAFSGAAESPSEGSLAVQAFTYNQGSNPVPLKPDGIQSSGGQDAHPNMPPFTAINFIICTFGMYPSAQSEAPADV